MKIVYIVTRSDHIGGAQVHVRDLATAVLRQGHEPIVLTKGEGPYTESLRRAGVQTISLRHLVAAIRPHKDTEAVAEIWTTLRRLQPDLVSTHSSKAGIVGRIAARGLGLPVIFTAHGWSFTTGIPARQAFAYRWIERLAAPLASRVIAVSEFDRQLAIKQRVIAPSKIVTVHNGMPDIEADLRANPAGEPVRMAMVARFEAQKDHGTLFRALGGLLHTPWHLDLIGDGPLLAQAEATVRELGMADRVRFWGQTLNVDHCLSEVQLALLISNWEGFPRSILEAMRAGLPVVASDVGGVSESVREGDNGFIIPPGDSQLLRQRLAQLLASPELRARMGRSGRDRYERYFQLRYAVEKTLHVYREVLSESLAGERWRRPVESPPAHPLDDE